MARPVISSETQLCVSIAARPGITGSKFFNNAFKKLGLNFIYKPFKVLPHQLAGFITAIKILNIRGCGVSMPHKIAVIKYLDQLDPLAKKIGAVNTIVNKNGRLKGYNTDYSGALQVIKEKYNVRGKKVLVVGAGGVARAIIVALQKLKAGKIYITNRHQTKARTLAKKFNLCYVPYKDKFRFKGDFLINATPMNINKKYIRHFEAAMNVVPGKLMARYQAVAQFKLYTGYEL